MTGEMDAEALLLARILDDERSREALRRQTEAYWRSRAIPLEWANKRKYGAMIRQHGERPELFARTLEQRTLYKIESPSPANVGFTLDDIARRAKADPEWQRVLRQDPCVEHRAAENERRRAIVRQSGHGGKNGHREYRTHRRC